MPNIAALLKDEISRLSRKEIRRQMGPMRKASAAHRRHIAALKREIARLEKSVAALGKRASAPAATAKDPETGAPMSESQLVDNLLTFLGAGHETTTPSAVSRSRKSSRRPMAATRVS